MEVLTPRQGRHATPISGHDHPTTSKGTVLSKDSTTWSRPRECSPTGSCDSRASRTPSRRPH